MHIEASGQWMSDDGIPCSEETLHCSSGPSCTYDGGSYQAGQTFPAGDGCNTCSCSPVGSIGCSKLACPPDAGLAGDPDAG
jgi:Pacifastin inhibitor (LCMII)